MEKRWVFHLSPEGEILVAGRTAATEVEKASALPSADAARILTRLFPAGDRWGRAGAAARAGRGDGRRGGARDALAVRGGAAHAGVAPGRRARTAAGRARGDAPAAVRVGAAAGGAPGSASRRGDGIRRSDGRSSCRGHRTQGAAAAHLSPADRAQDRRRLERRQLEVVAGKEAREHAPRPAPQGVGGRRRTSTAARGFPGPRSSAWRSVAVQLQIFKQGHHQGEVQLSPREEKMGRPMPTPPTSSTAATDGRPRPKPRASGRRWAKRPTRSRCTGAETGRPFVTGRTCSWSTTRSSGA